MARSSTRRRVKLSILSQLLYEKQKRRIDLSPAPFNSFPVAVKIWEEVERVLAEKLSILSQLLCSQFWLRRERLLKTFNSFPVAVLKGWGI
ncbi:MAG: hypothetical protein RMI04_09690, partial [Thermofilaceae archaeon]|nr:hypothetical protein [Thermofilaceae archaeon]